jgi:hypothetical protein
MIEIRKSKCVVTHFPLSPFPSSFTDPPPLALPAVWAGTRRWVAAAGDIDMDTYGTPMENVVGAPPLRPASLLPTGYGDLAGGNYGAGGGDEYGGSDTYGTPIEEGAGGGGGGGDGAEPPRASGGSSLAQKTAAMKLKMASAAAAEAGGEEDDIYGREVTAAPTSPDANPASSITTPPPPTSGAAAAAAAAAAATAKALSTAAAAAAAAAATAAAAAATSSPAESAQRRARAASMNGRPTFKALYSIKMPAKKKGTKFYIVAHGSLAENGSGKIEVYVSKGWSTWHCCCSYD